MNEYNFLDTYNGDTGLGLWVDFENFENTGLPDVFNDFDLENFIDNLKDWD